MTDKAVSAVLDRGAPMWSVPLTEAEAQELLDRLDAVHIHPRKDRRVDRRYRYRTLARVHLESPDGQVEDRFTVPTRNLSVHGLSFLLGRFCHLNTRCTIQLPIRDGGWSSLPAQTRFSRYLEAGVHEVAVQFDRAIDPAMYSASAGGGRILFVEDDPATVRLAEFHLKDANAVIDHVQNGAEGIRKATAENYDVVFMDLDLPGIDGFQAVESLRALGYAGPIVAATGLTDDEHHRQSLEAGCDLFLPKPYGAQELLLILHTLQAEPLYSRYASSPAMQPLIDQFTKELPAALRELRRAMLQQDRARAMTGLRDLKLGLLGHGFDGLGGLAARLEEALVAGAMLTELAEELEPFLRACLRARSCPS